MARRVSLEDIARETGYHRSTVSLALRGQPGISASTERAIKAAAERLGYRPDPVLQRMARQRWQAERQSLQERIAYISHAHWDRKPADALIRPLAETWAARLGYGIDTIEVTHELSAGTLTRIIRARGIRGVVFQAFRDREPPPSLELDWSRFAGVWCPAGRIRPPIHAVNFDAFLGSRLAFSKAREAGYRRIGPALFSHDPATEDDRARQGGILCEQAELPSSRRLPALARLHGDEDAFRHWFRKWKPDCVIGFTNTALAMLENMGLRVPEDVGFASLSVESDGSRVSGVIKDWDALVRAAVELLVSELRENHLGIPHAKKYVLIEPEWNEGETF